jgi:hypothetical protein
MKQKQVHFGVRMNRHVSLALAMILCSLIVGTIDGLAQQIFNQFQQPTLEVGRPYRDLDFCQQTRAAKTVITPQQFTLPPTNIVDLDDGYHRINFPASFRFNFNGVVHSSINVSINGFATFDNTKLVPAKQSSGLFTNSASFPDNVVAPFWGDHRFRVAADISNGYMPSEIAWVIDFDRDENCNIINYTRTNPITGQQETYQRRCLIIQWKNLNINDASINSSVANFQVRLYEATEENNRQGDIEFAYGQVGGNPNTVNTVVVTRGASVGIKGRGGFPGFLSDFWNGLLYVPALGANSRTDSTSIWQPSGGRSDAVIRFTAIPIFTQDQWGYGDADFSGIRGQRHFGMSQNRAVTANDARVILRSIVTKRYLDSVWKRQAYQGDVNHTGRFYFTTLRRNFSGDSIVAGRTIVWRRTIDVDQFTGKLVRRDLFEGDGLYGVGGRAPDLASLNQIYYEVTEYDAALIMRYISGRLPFLPWVRDNDTTGPDFGKVGDVATATNLMFGSAQNLSDATVRIPVYLNGTHNGVFGARFEFDSPILDVVVNESNSAQMNVDFTNEVAVITGNGEFDVNTPVAYVTTKAKGAINVSAIRFNEVEQADATINVANVEAVSSQVIPNPVVTSASIVVNTPGNTSIRIFDMFGNLIKTIVVNENVSRQAAFNWDTTNDHGIPVTAGTYVVSVVTDGIQTAQKISVVR